MNKWIKVSVVVAFAAVLGACSSAGTKKAAGAGDADTAGGVEDRGMGISDTGTGRTTTLQDTEGAGRDAFEDSSGLLANRIVYFDFDSSAIRSEDRAIINAHANYIAQHGTAKITLEGHADERGSREYNVALGERRANSVRQAMTLQGASANQIGTVSYGEERPISMGHDESAWRMNRRVEIVYQAR